MKSGVHDYIMKDHIRRIGPAIKRELGDAEIRRQKKQAIADLKIAKARVEESDRLKSTLLSNLSHEFRTPINGILGFSQVIEEEAADPDIKQSAIKIFNSGKRLMKTLDSIVWLAQLESGLTPNFKPFSLTRVIESVIINQQDFARYKKLNIEYHRSDEQTLCSDKELVTHALNCLLDNALKYTRDGTIEIASRLTGDETMIIAEIKVTDQGIGIAPENLEMIFEAFKQVSEGYARHYEGIGLGLTNTRKIVTLLGGTIKAESIQGKGSTFTLTFPSSIQQAMTEVPVQLAESKTSQIKTQPDQLKKSVLVVEDHETNAELISIYLKRGWIIDTAYNGMNAISMTRIKQYDLILLDINLGPGIDGIETLSHIRKIAGYEQTPIIAMTGYTQYGDKEKLLAQGCTHYMAKPFDRQTLAKVIDEIFTPV